MRSMNAVLLDWRPKRMAHVRVATALKLMLSNCLYIPLFVAISSQLD